MIYLQIALILAYFVFMAWLVIATYINYVLIPFRNKNFSISNGVSLTYGIFWGLVLTAPIAYGLILQEIGA